MDNNYTPLMKEVLRDAEIEAKYCLAKDISTDHLMSSLLSQDSECFHINMLYEMGLDVSVLKQEVDSICEAETERAVGEAGPSSSKIQESLTRTLEASENYNKVMGGAEATAKKLDIDIAPEHLMYHIFSLDSLLYKGLIEDLGYMDYEEFLEDLLSSISNAFSKVIKYGAADGDDAIIAALKQSGMSISDIDEELSFKSFILDENGEVTEVTGSTQEQIGNWAKEQNGETRIGDFLSQPEKRTSTEPKRAAKPSVLDSYCDNLTQMAMEDKIEPVFGREDEVRKIKEILLRKSKPNPLLVGEAGVGKTAIAQGLALDLVNGILECSPFPANTVIYNVDLARMVAGTKYRGEFEERIGGLISEVKEKKACGIHVILFIDEIHTIVGAGSAENALDAANILKPALADGSIKCIGATTFKEYKKTIEKDSALCRRFDLVKIEEPSKKDTVKILKGCRSAIEHHHSLVSISDDIIEFVVDVCDEYLPRRRFPDKALDVLDEVCSKKVIGHIKTPQSIKNEISKIHEIDNEFLKLPQSKKDDPKVMGLALQTLEGVDRRISSLKGEYFAGVFSKKSKVSKRLVAEVISGKTGVPVSKILNEKTAQLKKMDKSIRSKVFGQDAAVKDVCDAVKVSYFGLNDPKKPIASFLFAGTSGVGKTHIAKQLAEEVFGGEKHLIRFDMSEYSSSTSAQKLIGADPGFVGYEEGGVLIEAVKKNPHSVILFDEIEKSHDSVKNTLLQLLDDGILTDNTGETVHFNNCVIILTTNAGSVAASVSTVGFVEESDEVKSDSQKKIIKDSFSPEFISRVGKVIIFDQLKDGDKRKIANRELGKIKEAFEKKGIKVAFNKSITEFLIKDDKIQTGARPILNKTLTILNPMLANYFIDNDADNVSVSYLDGKIVIK